MILLMPQGDVGSFTNCWDGRFPGFTDTDNWSHDGVQVKAIKGMIDRMLEPKVAATISLLEASTWDMPPSYDEVNASGEENTWFGKIPNMWRILFLD
jgi:hypothetical protein